MREYGTLLRIQNAKDAEAGMTKIKELGFSYCQLVYKPDKYTEEDAKTIRLAMEKQGVKIVSLFAGYRDSYTKWDAYEDYKTAGINSRRYGKQRIQYIKSAALFAKSLGVPDILIHAGFIANNPFSKEYRYMKKCLETVAVYCKSIGMNLILETGGESPITLRRIIEDMNLGNIFVNLDTANLIMYGLGNPVDAVYTLGTHIRSLHIKDGLPPVNPKELGKETPIGEGFVDFKRFFEELRRTEFAGPIIIEREIEGQKQAEDLKKAIAYLNSMIDESLYLQA